MFPIEPGKDYAVLTGDVVDSSSLEAEPRRELPRQIHQISETLGEWLGTDALTPVSVFGGDSWRVLVRDPANGLRVGLFLRASLLASPLELDTRFVLAVGGVDFVPDDQIEEADGEAFRLSGQLLQEGLPRSVTMAFACANAEVSQRWNLTLRLIDALVRTNWTSNRARAVSGALRGWPDAKTGELWPSPIGRQTVGRHLAEAGWDAIEAANQAYLKEWLL